MKFSILKMCDKSKILTGLLFVIAGCFSSSTETPDSASGEAPPNAASGPPPALVRVKAAKRESIAPRLVAVGTVRPRHLSVIASAADGVVEKFDQEQGAFVKAGTVLSQLRMFSTDLALEEQRAVLKERDAHHQMVQEPRQEDVEEATAKHLAAQADFENAERRLKELQSLADRGATNPSAVDDAEDLVAASRQHLLAARAVAQKVSAGARKEEKLQAQARLMAQQKHVAWLEAEKEKRITRAPFDGFIVKEQSYLGQWLSKGDPVVTMAQLDEVDVEVPVDQDFISQVAIGAEVKLTIAGVPGSSGTDNRWAGTVHRIVPRSDWQAGSRSFPVIVRIKNTMTGSPTAPIPALREGMMAEAEFFGNSFEATLVPKDSLVRTSRGTFIFAVNAAEPGEPKSVRQVPVVPGISKEDWIEVTTDALEPGTDVVTEGAERLRPFQSVQILDDAPTQEP